MTANVIKEDKLVPTLLTVVGSAHYTLLRGLIAPKMLKDFTFDKLKETLKSTSTQSRYSSLNVFTFTNVTRARVRLSVNTWPICDTSLGYY